MGLSQSQNRKSVGPGARQSTMGHSNASVRADPVSCFCFHLFLMIPFAVILFFAAGFYWLRPGVVLPLVLYSISLSFDRAFGFCLVLFVAFFSLEPFCFDYQFFIRFFPATTHKNV